MILDFCSRHADAFGAGPSGEDLAQTRAFLRRVPTPFDLPAATIHCVAQSNLLRACQTYGRDRLSAPVARIDALPDPPAAEHARLLSKGRLLYEHCMQEVSSACVIGFIDHELRKTLTTRRIVGELLGWMLEQRSLWEHPGPDDASLATSAGRLAHTDYLLDLGVSLLHGIPRAVALQLAGDKEP